MADWSKITTMGDVEDRRGSPLAVAGGGISLLAVGVAIVFSLLTGGNIDIGSILAQLPQTSVPSTITSQDFEGFDDYEKFTATVLGSTNEYWQQTFSAAGKQYDPPKLVLFRQATRSACGIATSEVGPHYCPTDATIYIDETFYDELRARFQAKGGDVAEAYVLAHEVGHHVQHQLGLLGDTALSNQESVQVELQADCFAGLWANSINHLNVFEAGEINEALDAAAAVGDDRIQSRVQGRVNPETWTHGSSEQRMHWFGQGYTTGEPARCDTSQG